MCKAKVDFGTHIRIIYPVIRGGNKSSIGDISFVENKCVGTLLVAVSDVGVQTCNNKKVAVSDKSVILQRWLLLKLHYMLGHSF